MVDTYPVDYSTTGNHIIAEVPDGKSAYILGWMLQAAGAVEAQIQKLVARESGDATPATLDYLPFVFSAEGQRTELSLVEKIKIQEGEDLTIHLSANVRVSGFIQVEVR